MILNLSLVSHKLPRYSTRLCCQPQGASIFLGGNLDHNQLAPYSPHGDVTLAIMKHGLKVASKGIRGNHI